MSKSVLQEEAEILQGLLQLLGENWAAFSVLVAAGGGGEEN